VFNVERVLAAASIAGGVPDPVPLYNHKSPCNPAGVAALRTLQIPSEEPSFWRDHPADIRAFFSDWLKFDCVLPSMVVFRIV